MKLRPSGLSLLFALLSAALLSLTGCGSSKPPDPKLVPDLIPSTRATVGFPRDITDSRGKKLTLYGQPTKIVSLAPSDTEILFALGLGDKIVGDTTACDYPPQAKDIQHIGGAKIEVESVEAKEPNLIVADDSLGSDMGDTIRVLEEANMPVITVNPKTVSQVYDSIKLIAQATGTEAQADKIINGMKSRIEQVKLATSKAASKPKVFICYGLKPDIYTTGSGTFIDDLITIAGGKNIVTTPSPQGDLISSEEVAGAQPDVIIASKALVAQIKQMSGWSRIPAVRNNRFFIPSSEDILVRPGPRLAQGAEQLAHYLHPDLVKTTGSKP